MLLYGIDLRFDVGSACFFMCFLLVELRDRRREGLLERGLVLARARAHIDARLVALVRALPDHDLGLLQEQLVLKVVRRKLLLLLV